MRLALVVPVLNHKDETQICLGTFREMADHWQDIDKLIVDNGSTIPASEWGILGLDTPNFIRNEQNIGVLPALQQAWEQLKTNWEIWDKPADYILYTHNDVTMYEVGWDTKVLRTLEGINAGQPAGVGVATFYGAKGIGTTDLYNKGYEMHQLVRVENVSNCARMPSTHGYRQVKGEWEKIAVADGFSLIVSTKFLKENDGFDLNLPPHHNYDNHTCLQALDLGYINIVIPMDAFHHGGVTDVSEDWEKPFGKSKSDIHRDAHYPYFYNYWSPESAEIRKGQGKVGITLPIYIQ